MLLEDYSILQDLQILVVDDQIETCFPLTVLLQLHGAEVMLASSVKEALQALKSNRVDVLLCDIELPGEDGYSLMRRVKTLFPNPQQRPATVAMTALSAQESCQRALTAGFGAYLNKPFEANELLMALSPLLEPRVKPDWVDARPAVSMQLYEAFA
ncbi:response regulator [Phormidium tenue FACHB-886]|nr:response regulator [Phormidium tenue FACHB-886]